MDFDKILRQWEESQKQGAKKKNASQGPGKKANAPLAGESGEEVPAPASGLGRKPDARIRRTVTADDYLNHWITVHGVPDKDESGGTEGNDRRDRIEEAERLRHMKPQAVIDLHGKTAAEAEALLVDFLLSSSRSGMEKVLIIHGKGLHSAGEPVIADVVRRALEANSLAGSYGPADRNLGGRGATWVRIRKRDYFSR